MLELESPAPPSSSTAPPSLSQPVTLLLVLEGNLVGKPAEAQTNILHLTTHLDISIKVLLLTETNLIEAIMPPAPLKSQYTEVNFSSNFLLFLIII